jgi:coproporphyrinogen III oxidase
MDHSGILGGAGVLAGALAVSGMGCWAPAAGAADDERLARLVPADQAVAREVSAFIASMDAKYLGRVAELNGGAGFERLEMATDDTDYLVRVTRGPVIEKAGTMIAVGKKAQPGRIPGVLLWSRFYSIDLHPKTPLVGMLHATVVVQFYEGGRSFAGGWLGVMNGTRNAADMAALKAVTDGHFARHGRDPAPYRSLIVKGTEDTVAAFRRRPDDSGVSFYGPPVFPGDTARSYHFVAELFDAFTGAYLDIVEKRATQDWTPVDLVAQDEMRKRWLVDQLFSDPFASKLVPFEVWSLANVPPVVRF